jgi:hypothetical protein
MPQKIGLRLDMTCFVYVNKAQFGIYMYTGHKLVSVRRDRTVEGCHSFQRWTVTLSKRGEQCGI